MIQKILIAEDIDSIGLGLEAILKENDGVEVVQTRYCDEALIKFKKAFHEGEPFDLLITDLSFTEDHRIVKLKNGEELAEAVRALQPEIKILVYSVEDKINKIRRLFSDIEINGFICKGRNSSNEILTAIKVISSGESYFPPQFAHIINNSSVPEISQYELRLLYLLGQGYTQLEIAEKLKQEEKPGSSSYIEKTINRLRISLKAKNTVHLVSVAKDLGLI